MAVINFTEGIFKPFIRFFVSLTHGLIPFVSSSSTDDIIKRKLLIDGDGLGDDRRINIMLKTFFKWCSTNENDEEQ